MAHDCLIFDLDGTLTEPKVGILRCFNHALRTHGYPTLGEDEISPFIGPPLDEGFRRLTGQRNVMPLVDTYRERYAEVGYAENEVYPGVAEALEVLSRRGVVLGLCTSKRVDFAERILVHFELRRHFAFLSGGVLGIPKAAQLGGLLKEGLAGPGSTMIGDRAVDIQAGKTHGLRTVAVLWGHGSDAELRAEGPDLVLGTPVELQGLEKR